MLSGGHKGLVEGASGGHMARPEGSGFRAIGLYSVFVQNSSPVMLKEHRSNPYMFPLYHWGPPFGEDPRCR